MTNFYTPKAKQFSTLELLSFYGLGLKISNPEQQAPIYRFYKKNENAKSKILAMFGFDTQEVFYSTTDGEKMTAYIKSYIAKNFNDAKEIKHGIYQINM